MTQGPLGVPRPFAKEQMEINIYFKETDLDNEDILPVQEIVHNTPMLSSFSSGPTGQRGNVVSVSTSGNVTVLSSLTHLRDRINDTTDLTVDDIEVIA